MKDAEKFIDWLLENGYLEEEDLSTDRDEMVEDFAAVHETAPRLYNLLKNISDR